MLCFVDDVATIYDFKLGKTRKLGFLIETTGMVSNVFGVCLPPARRSGGGGGAVRSSDSRRSNTDFRRRGLRRGTNLFAQKTLKA